MSSRGDGTTTARGEAGVAALPASELTHMAILASAGSGKTFQLTHRYLALLAAGAEPASILGTTFTRLAAGQIRDRILSTLAAAARDDAARRELSERLGLAKPLTRAAAASLFERVARKIHRLQLRTLDSFFAALIRAFPIELGLPPNCEVIEEEDAAALRDEAIRLMLDEREPERLIEILRLLTRGASTSSVVSEIETTVTDLHGVYLESGATAWESVPNPKGRLREAEVVEAIDALRAEEIPENKTFLNAHLAAIDAATGRDWSAFLGKGLGKKIAEGETTFARKEIEDDLRAAYEPLVRHARADLVGRVRDQNLATLELLRLYDDCYRRVRDRERRLTFRDMTDALRKAERLGGLEEIAYRLDARLDHLLLDEFQDTSVPQWRALTPMVDEIVATAPPAKTFFCVGDVKQSIYGWRDAAPELLENLTRLYAGPDGTGAIEEAYLAKSYRSSPVVIDAVNRVFSDLERNEALREHAPAAAAWDATFRPHETARVDLSGHARLEVMPREASGDPKRRRFNRAAELAAELYGRNPRATVAVLTRTNRAVAIVSYELNGRGVRATGRGGTPLPGCPSVDALLDLVRLADQPDDTVSAFHVSNSPLGAPAGLERWDDAPARRRVARDLRRALLEEGYARTLGRYVRDLLPACDRYQSERLLALLELAGEWDDRRPTLRPWDFVKFVDARRVPETGEAPVHVMTIHQAKGLEFDAVILPELNGKLTGRGGGIAIEREAGVGPISRVCRHVNAETRALMPDLAPVFDAAIERSVRESLCVLYVAMTRAKRGLYLLVDPPAIRKDGTVSKTIHKSPEGILRAALAPDGFEAGETAYEAGEEGWIDG